MTKEQLIPNKEYYITLNSISYLNDRPIEWGTKVKFLKEDFGFWFELQSGEKAMVADEIWFKEITSEAGELFNKINAISENIGKLVREKSDYFKQLDKL